MLETLAGRLKWEATNDGICVGIPAHLSAKGWLFPPSFGLVWLWLMGEDAVRWAVNSAHVSAPRWSFMASLLAIPVLILCWFLWIILTSTRIVLSADIMAIEYRVLGVRWLSLRYPNPLLHNPRLSRKNTVFPASLSELQIDRDYRTKALAVGVVQAEAEAVIAKMMEVYPFPKYLPNESATEFAAG